MKDYSRLKEVMTEKGYKVTEIEDYAALSFENDEHLINYYTLDDRVSAHQRPNGKTLSERRNESTAIKDWFKQLVEDNVK